MADQHRASLEDWDFVEANFPNSICDCILELRDRIAALEQQNKDVCIAINNAVVWNTEQNQRIAALEAAQASAQPTAPAPAGSLVERVARAIYNDGGDFEREARAAIREVAAWLDSQIEVGAAHLLSEEANRG